MNTFLALLPIFALIGIILAIGLVINFAELAIDKLLDPPLRMKRLRILSQNETRLYNYLIQASNGRYFIAIKPSLRDVLAPESSRGRSLSRKLDHSHIDFLLVNPLTGESMLAIELDDRTHDRDRSRERDEQKDRLLKAAQLPILRTRAGHDWASEIESALNPTPVPAPTSPKARSPLSTKICLQEIGNSHLKSPPK